MTAQRRARRGFLLRAVSSTACTLLLGVGWGAWSAANAFAQTSQTSADRLPALEQRTRVITTISQRADGREQENRGSGVVVGRYFLTVHHNLAPGPRDRLVSSRSYLDGIPVAALVADPLFDIAILPIPASLCASWCQPSSRLLFTDVDLAQTVRWYRDANSAPSVEPGWRQARITSRTLSLPGHGKGFDAAAACDSGLVLEVDRPFLPGSSGAGVWDAENRLVGIVQGSYETRDGRESGYFKPLRCIARYWPDTLAYNDAAGVRLAPLHGAALAAQLRR